MKAPLQKLLRDRLAQLGLSYRQAADRSQGLISYGTIGKIGAGRHTGRLDDSSIAGLALALDLPESTIRESANAPPKRPVEFSLPAKASRLSPRSRKALLDMLNALLVAEDAAARATESDQGTTERDDNASSV